MERIKRNDYLQQVYSYLGKGEVVVLTGHRRAGKSCILELLAAELSIDGNVIYIDMENPENADIATFRELSERIKDSVVPGHRNYVLIDEVQEVEKFEKTFPLLSATNRARLSNSDTLRTFFLRTMSFTKMVS